MLHELKTWPGYFQAVWDGIKNFECRKDDRGFQVGDYLDLKEYDPATDKYSGRHILVQVSYLFKVPDSPYVVMACIGRENFEKARMG